MNIIHGIPAPYRVGTGPGRKRINPNNGTQERRKLVFAEDRRKSPDRRTAQQRIPIELRSGEDRREKNRLSITT